MYVCVYLCMGVCMFSFVHVYQCVGNYSVHFCLSAWDSQVFANVCVCVLYGCDKHCLIQPLRRISEEHNSLSMSDAHLFSTRLGL